MSSPRPRPLPRREPDPPPVAPARVAPPAADPRQVGARRRTPRQPPSDNRVGGAGRLRPTSSCAAALAWMVVAVGVLWLVELANVHDDYQLDRFGLVPRETSGLWGVLTMPFLHASAGHMLSNTLPFVIIGWVVLLGGVRTWAIVTVTVVVLGGFLTWLVGPSQTVIVGASGLVFGWLGYLLARAVFSRRLKWIMVAVLVLFFFGTLLFGLFPTLNSNVSWQAHACGFAAGAVSAFVLHPRGGATRTFRRSAVS